MTNIVALNSRTHRTLRVKAGASAADRRRFVPVVIGEFPYLVAHYPILLAKDAETGAFYCGAMLGIDEGENLFLDGGDAYRPLNLRREPFYTAGDDLAIDLDSPRVDPRGELLFTDDGKPTRFIESVMAIFRELKPGIESTRQFIEALMQLKLVEVVDIRLDFDDGTRRQLQGLYTINQDALMKLPDAAVVDLFRRGHLGLVHMMIASLQQVRVLAQKKNRGLSEPTPV